MFRMFDAKFEGSRLVGGGQRVGGLMMTVLVFGAIGCGSGESFQPILGLVEGTVTINGAPAADVMVTFEPQSNGDLKKSMIGSASTAMTDAQGKFELQYGGGGTKGAVVGPHVVRIASTAGGGPAGGEKGLTAAFIPPNYNSATTLKANVAEGENPPLVFKLDIPKR